MHGKWDFLLFGIDNSSRKTTNDDFHNNYIKAIMTVREMNWLTSQDFKKRVHLYQNYSFDSGQKVRFWR